MATPPNIKVGSLSCEDTSSLQLLSGEEMTAQMPYQFRFFARRAVRSFHLDRVSMDGPYR